FFSSAHDLAEGGLAVALAECCVTTPDFAGEDIGAAIDLPAEAPQVDATFLFGEAPSRILVSVAPDKASTVIARAFKLGVSATEIGKTGGKTLIVKKEGKIVLQTALADLRAARESCLDKIARE